MSGPTNNAKEQSLLSKQDWWQRLVEIGGVVVFVGLLIEDGPEIWEAMRHGRLPSRGVIGGIIVAVGVWVEVLFASLATHISKQLQGFAEARNAELRGRAAKAEQDAAEASLASRKLEAMLVDRKLSNPIGFIEAMRTFSGTPVTFIAADDMESVRLCSALENALKSAGWTIDPMPQHVSGLSECVVLALQFDEWYTHGPLRNATVALGDWLNEDGIVTAPEFQPIKTFTGVTIKVGPRPSTLTAFEALRKGWRWTLDQLIVR